MLSRQLQQFPELQHQRQPQQQQQCELCPRGAARILFYSRLSKRIARRKHNKREGESTLTCTKVLVKLESVKAYGRTAEKLGVYSSPNARGKTWRQRLQANLQTEQAIIKPP